MAYPVDLSLLRGVSHMPALPALERSMNRPDLRLHDFCIPVNPYFPTEELMADLRAPATTVPSAKLSAVFCDSIRQTSSRPTVRRN